jgi:phosphoglycerate dehydrogenase-like enzyme
MKPDIVILNSSSFGKHHPDQIRRLEEFAKLRRVNVPADISAKELTAALGNPDGIIASVTPRIPGQTLQALTKLTLLARHGIGCDNVDLKAATELGIPVAKVEGIVERDAVAELALALILSAARYLQPGAIAVKESRWQDRSQFIGIELRNKRIGLIGLGNIGSRVAEILSRGFNSEVVACDPYLPQEAFSERCARSVSLDELLQSSDVISFHCPLKEDTRRMLGRDRFRLIKPGAILINTCRGELLEEEILVDALKSGQLRAYGTDVVEGEPIDGSHRLLKLPNVIVLPHLGGYSVESLRGMGETMVNDCIRVFQKGEPPALLANPEVLNKGLRRWH